MVDALTSVPQEQPITFTYKAFQGNARNEDPEKSDRTLEKTTKNVIENGKVVVEQYDRHGKLIRKTPPGYLLPGQKS